MRAILTTAGVTCCPVHMQCTKTRSWITAVTNSCASRDVWGISMEYVFSLFTLCVLMHVHVDRVVSSYHSDRNPALAEPAPVWFGSGGNVCGSAVWSHRETRMRMRTRTKMTTMIKTPHSLAPHPPWLASQVKHRFLTQRLQTNRSTYKKNTERKSYYLHYLHYNNIFFTFKFYIDHISFCPKKLKIHPRWLRIMVL